MSESNHIELKETILHEEDKAKSPQHKVTPYPGETSKEADAKIEINQKPLSEMATSLGDNCSDCGTRTSTQAMMTFGAAIILHSLIDGLAIGVFEDEKSVVILVASVIIHKIPVSCTLGTTFLSNGHSLKQKTTLLIFSLFVLASPIGILLGTSIGSQSDSLGTVIIQSLSGGTFIYLACCDLLIYEFHQSKLSKTLRNTLSHEDQVKRVRSENSKKFLALILGVAVVVVLMVLAPSHSHDH